MRYLLKIFNSESAFNQKHIYRRWDCEVYTDAFGGLEKAFTVDIDKYGWMLNLINNVGKNFNAFNVSKTVMKNFKCLTKSSVATQVFKAYKLG